MDSIYIPVGYSNAVITQITSPNESVFSVFIDPQDGELVIQSVVVWAVIEFYSTANHAKPQVVKTLIRGLTEMPDTPYLIDNAVWDDNFVGYFRPNAPTLDDDSTKRLMGLVNDYKRRHKDAGKGQPTESISPDGQDGGDDGGGDEGPIDRRDPNFWKDKLPGNPEWTD